MAPKLPLSKALQSAIAASHAAGKMMRDNLRSTKKINEATQHDIKLELDVRCQKRIERELRRKFPEVAILGEEGITGDPESEYRWVVDPIDGTVNFTYGIPHAAVSIALQMRNISSSDYDTLVGVVYDPFCDELWTAVRGGSAMLDRRPIHASSRGRLNEALVAIGFAKRAHTLGRMMPTLNTLIHKVRKIRVMGSAALAMVYVASGRFDAYIEYGLRLWDIAAGGLILECAGGDFWRQPVEGDYTYRILANNGPLRQRLERFTK